MMWDYEFLQKIFLVSAGLETNIFSISKKNYLIAPQMMYWPFITPKANLGH
jgi:hypothetical protein